MLEGLHARGFDDLVPAHLNVLQYPPPDGVRPSELAARTRMTKQALNYLLNQLEQLGYVERRGDPADPRARRVHLTRRGRATMTAMREIVGEVEAEWEDRLGARDFARLRELLTRLGEVGDHPAQPRAEPTDDRAEDDARHAGRPG